MTPHLCPQMYYVYVLVSQANGEIYIGYTNDLQRRIQEHHEKKSISTRWRLPVNLVYFEGYLLKTDALRREKNLKYHGKALGQLKGRIKDSLCAGKGAG